MSLKYPYPGLCDIIVFNFSRDCEIQTKVHDIETPFSQEAIKAIHIQQFKCNAADQNTSKHVRININATHSHSIPNIFEGTLKRDVTPVLTRSKIESSFQIRICVRKHNRPTNSSVKTIVLHVIYRFVEEYSNVSLLFIVIQLVIWLWIKAIST